MSSSVSRCQALLELIFEAGVGQQLLRPGEDPWIAPPALEPGGGVKDPGPFFADPGEVMHAIGDR